jgi:DNA-binding transcriptional LysR family regulator
VLHPAVARLFKLRTPPVQFLVNDFVLARELLREGVGVGVLPSFVARTYVREGLLEEVPFGKGAERLGELVLLYPSSGQTPKKVTAFRDFLVEALRAGV